MNIADDVKKIRLKCLLSQEGFAKEIGVAFATVNRWETGKTKPTYKTLRQIDSFCKKNNLEYNIVIEIGENNNE